MTASSSELRGLVTEARPLIESMLDTAEIIAGLREVATAKGFDWSQIKALIKAQIQDEKDGKHRVRAIVEKAESATAYAGMLGWGVEEINENILSAQAAE